jgi:hypothetical protein
MPQDPSDIAYVPETPTERYTHIRPTSEVAPFTSGTGTYAVSNSLSTPISITITTSAIRLRSFSIVPLSSSISVAFFFRYGSWTIGTNPPAVNSTFTIAGIAYTKDLRDGTGRYPQLNGNDVIQLIVIASGSGYISVDIDGEYA